MTSPRGPAAFEAATGAATAGAMVPSGERLKYGRVIKEDNGPKAGYAYSVQSSRFDSDSDGGGERGTCDGRSVELRHQHEPESTVCSHGAMHYLPATLSEVVLGSRLNLLLLLA